MIKTPFPPVPRIFLMLATSFILFCNPPDNPDQPSKTKINTLIKTSDGKQHINDTEDTIGKKVSIGAALFLPAYFDSIKLTIKSNDDTLFDTMLSDFRQSTFFDTLWHEAVFYTPGNKTIIFVPYTSVNISPVMATITIIVPDDLPENHPPSISVAGERVRRPGETFELSVSALDPDTFQQLSINISGMPSGSRFEDNVLTWKTSGNLSGRDTLVFIVSDNGYPQQSDSAVAVITITTTPHAPQLTVKGNATVQPSNICTLLVCASDEDSGQTLKTTMSGNPDGSAIVNDSLFIWPVPANAAGEHVITFTVTDNGVPPLSACKEVTLTIDDSATVSDFNRPPVANAPDTLQTRRGIAREITLAACDPDGDSIAQWKVVSGPFNGTISANNTKTFTYTPEMTYEGRDSIAYRVWDATDSSNIDTIKIIVTRNDVAPVFSAKPQTTSTDSGTSVTFTSAINTDAYPAPEYRWLKGNDTVATTGPDFTISSLKYSHQGEYKLIVTNQAATIEAPFTLTVTDKTAPVITLSGAADTTILLNGTWNEPGFSAVDDRDGNINENITITGAVTATSVGKYKINYAISDAAGNPAVQKMRTVRVEGWVTLDSINANNFKTILSRDSTFYIMYIDPSTELAQVAKIIDGKLVPLGGDFTTTTTYAFSVAAGNDGTSIYAAAITDVWNSPRVIIKKLSGGVWITLISQHIPIYHDNEPIDLVIGPDNSIYLAGQYKFTDNAESDTYAGIKKVTDNTLQTVSAIDSVITNSDPTGDDLRFRNKKSLLFTSDNIPYFCGRDSTSRVPVVKKLVNNLWVKAGTISTDTSFGNGWINNLHLLINDDVLYCGYTISEATSNLRILQFNGSTWTDLPSMGEGDHAGFNMAFSSNGILYAVYPSGTNIQVRSFNGTTWTNVPVASEGIAFQDECVGVSIAPGPNECYVTYLKDSSTGKTIIRHWKRQ